jgi:hypothetical protein
MDEVNEKIYQNGKYTFNDLNDILTTEMLSTCEYLSFFSKESLRRGTVLATSLFYQTK